jgi:hypothetical protein
MVSRISLGLQIVSLALFGGDYYFTYSISSENITVSSEKLQISKAMTESQKKPSEFFYIFNDKHVIGEKEFVKQYSDEIVELILENRAGVKSSAKVRNSNVLESSTVKSSPTLVSIDFKEDFGIIGIYEQTP